MQFTTICMLVLLCVQVAAFQCLQPFIGTLLAFWVLKEEPTAWDLGAIGIVAGLLLVSTDKRDIDTQSVLARIKRMLSSRHQYLSKSIQITLWPGDQRH
jgi:drug/metabolite transporter (DMT)-like permease